MPERGYAGQGRRSIIPLRLPRFCYLFERTRGKSFKASYKVSSSRCVYRSCTFIVCPASFIRISLLTFLLAMKLI